MKHPPYFDGMTAEPVPAADIVGARVLAKLGDSVTTDHISPAGSIARHSPAGRSTSSPKASNQSEFNSYGARRGNHEVMMRGTFANTRLRNELVHGVEGGVTRYMPDDGEADVDLRRRDEVQSRRHAGDRHRPARSTARASSRDWAAKGPMLLGVRAVIVEIVRAHPSQQPDRHGHLAARLQGR